jgi:hypothetical protein
MATTAQYIHILVRKDMDVNEHETDERLSNITL